TRSTAGLSCPPRWAPADRTSRLPRPGNSPDRGRAFRRNPSSGRSPRASARPSQRLRWPAEEKSHKNTKSTKKEKELMAFSLSFLFFVFFCVFCGYPRFSAWKNQSHGGG